MKTTASRDRDNKFQIETTIELGFDRRELRIDTHKSYFGGGVKTDCRVVQVSEDGRAFTHVFGLSASGDFSKTLAHDKAARGTEKVITAQHAAVLAGVDALLVEARAFYGKD